MQWKWMREMDSQGVLLNNLREKQPTHSRGQPGVVHKAVPPKVYVTIKKELGQRRGNAGLGMGQGREVWSR